MRVTLSRIAAMLACLTGCGAFDLGTSERVNDRVNPEVPIWYGRPSGALDIAFRRELTNKGKTTGEEWEHGRGEIDPVNGRMFMGSADHGLYALRATDGSTIWRYETLGAVQSEPYYDAELDVVYFGAHDGALYAVRAFDGSLVFRFDTGAEVTRKPVRAGETIFVANAGDYLYALDRRTGKRKWSAHRNSALGMEVSGYSGPAYANGVIYMGFSDGHVAAFDAKLAAAICERLSSCCAQADYDGFFARFREKPYTLAAPPPAASCATELAAQLAVMHDKWVASVGRGRMTFDGARASRCVSDVGAAACGAPLLEQIYGAACLGVRGNEVFAKIAPVGSDCTDLGDGTFYGECDPKQGYCDETKKCAAWKKTGEPCGILLQDAGPTRRLFCAPDLNCDGQSPKTPGKCSGPPVTKAIGESCSASTGPTELCSAGAFCDLFGSGKCTPKKPDGADCAYDDECTSERPLTCGPQGSDPEPPPADVDYTEYRRPALRWVDERTVLLAYDEAARRVGAGFEEIVSLQAVRYDLDAGVAGTALGEAVDRGFEQRRSAIDADDTIGLYLKEIGRVPLLTASEEVSLAKRIEKAKFARERIVRGGVAPNKRRDLEYVMSDDMAAREHLITANSRLVISVAKKYIGRGVPFLDLIQEGNIGLMKAVERFDHSRGYRFSTYASWWIRHAISRALADKGRAVRIPVHMLDTHNRVQRATQAVIARTGRDPTLAELEHETGIPQEKLDKVKGAWAETPFSLDRPVGDEDGRKFIDFLQDEQRLSPYDTLISQKWGEEVRRLLGTLTPIESRIIRWRFGLDDEDELTLKEIGDKYNLSRERIRQLQEQALTKIRKHMRD